MNSEPSPTHDFPNLWEDVCQLGSLSLEGELDEKQQRRLEALLCDDPRARALYVNFMQESAALSIIASGVAGAPVDSMMSDHTGTKGNSVDLELHLQRMWYTSLRPVPLSLTIAALFIGLLLTSMAYVFPPLYQKLVDSGDELKAPITVARLTGTHDAVWAKGQVAGHHGARLTVGHRMRLEQGLVEVSFGDGAILLLEGPAEFVVASRSEGSLSSGKLSARVDTPQAHGFAVNVPGARIVDLGTEFGVEVAGSGAAEVVVLEGEVEITATSTEPSSPRRLKLAAGESASIEKRTGNLQRHPAVDNRLVAESQRRLSFATTPSVDPNAKGLLVFKSATKISSGDDFSVSVYDGQAGYAGTGALAHVTGMFGDGTVEAYCFVRNHGGNAELRPLDRYAYDGGSILAGPTHTNDKTTGGTFANCNLWTTTDPGSDFSGRNAANFAVGVPTISGAHNVRGRVDISAFAGGTVYILAGAYDNSVAVNLSMTGRGLPQLTAANTALNTARERNLYVFAFDFDNADLAYDAIHYHFSNTGNNSANRARFMGVIVDGSNLPKATRAGLTSGDE